MDGGSFEPQDRQVGRETRPEVSFMGRRRMRWNEKDASSLSPLSRREVQVLVEVDKGASNREIAYGLSVTEDTVKYHLKNIYRKLSVTRRTGALNVAKELGLIER